MIHVVARPVSEALRPFVAAFHYHDGESCSPAVERILPTGQAHLMINLAEDEFRSYSGTHCDSVYRHPGAVLAGPHGQATAIDTREQTRLIAVEFRPGGAAAFVRMPISETCDQIVALEDIWGRNGRTLRERVCEAHAPRDKIRVLEQALLECLLRPADGAVAAAVWLLERGMSVEATGSRLGLLPKTFVRRFRERIGMAPKRFSRVRRLQRIIASISQGSDEVDWCTVAAEHGYADQAHLVHDFRDLTGITPCAYKPASPARRNHVPVLSSVL